MNEVRKLAENYVKTQIRSWNGHSAKISKQDIQKAIDKVAKALLETRKASAKAAAK
jgi:hypothetical protein